MFYGRKEELNKIKRRLKLDSFQAVLVYGRRRIGKTELINEAISQTKSNCLSLLARNVNLSINLEDFSRDAAKFMGNVSFHPKDFYEFYATLMEYSKNHPFILFIDEYCFLKNNDDSVDSFLQKAIEFHQKDAKITIILCGSYIDTMRRIVDQKAPLYGRFNEEILLHTFDYYDASSFMSGLPNDEKIKYYAVFGGTAFNLKNIDYSVPFEENLINEFIKIDSFFEKEAISIIKNEVEKESNVNTIFELIASGKNKYKELNDLMGDPSKDNIGRYIRKLESMDLIDKSFMANAQTERRPIYYIKDNLLDFYYTFLSKYIRQRSSMAPNIFFENYVKDAFYTQYLPRKFEEIVKEYVVRNNGIKIPLFDSVGRIYYNSGNINREFDVVLNKNNVLTPIECKYTKEKVGMKDYYHEKEQWLDLPFKINQFGFASRSGFDDDIKRHDTALLISLEDLFK